jgi:hypothetical protein
MSEHEGTAVLSATARHEAAAAQVSALHQRLRSLQQTDPFARSDEDEDEMGRLERRLSEMEALLPSLHALARQERATVDVSGLVESWQPLMQQKIAAYDALAVKIHEVWGAVSLIEAVHAEQEDLLMTVEDATVRAYLLSTFWIDVVTIRTILSNNIFPSKSWTDFLCNPLGLRVSDGSSIAANDPGCSPLPERMVENVVEGRLLAPRDHRASEVS